MTIAADALPELSDAYPLSAEQIATYQRDGHICLRGVASPAEVAEYSPLFAKAVAARSKAVRPMEERDTYGKAFLQIMNLWREDERLKRFVFARRFAKLAAELMGVSGVRLYHDQALYKEPFGGHTPWHQDQHYWPLDTDNTVTLWMPLVDITADMGVMDFASGSHRLGYLGDMPISDESEAAWSQLDCGEGFRGGEPRRHARRRRDLSHGVDAACGVEERHAAHARRHDDHLLRRRHEGRRD
jgi:hypothetical protein